MRRHLSKHTGSGRVLCQGCKKDFSRKDVFLSHACTKLSFREKSVSPTATSNDISSRQPQDRVELPTSSTPSFEEIEAYVNATPQQSKDGVELHGSSNSTPELDAYDNATAQEHEGLMELPVSPTRPTDAFQRPMLRARWYAAFSTEGQDSDMSSENDSDGELPIHQRQFRDEAPISSTRTTIVHHQDFDAVRNANSGQLALHHTETAHQSQSTVPCSFASRREALGPAQMLHLDATFSDSSLVDPVSNRPAKQPLIVTDVFDTDLHCVVCERRHTDPKQLKEHLAQHLDDATAYRYSCLVCNTAFRHYRQLLAHREAAKDLARGKGRCYCCGVNFANLALESHNAFGRHLTGSSGMLSTLCRTSATVQNARILEQIKEQIRLMESRLCDHLDRPAEMRIQFPS
jgi:hypothetical protein